jgi:hypothetical protein
MTLFQSQAEPGSVKAAEFQTDPLLLLCHKLRRVVFGLFRALQHGHRCRLAARAMVRRRRIVATELGHGHLRFHMDVARTERRTSPKMVGQGGRPGAARLRFSGGDNPPRQGDRNCGQGGRDAAAGDNGLRQSPIISPRPASTISPVCRQGRARAVVGRLWLMDQ